MKYFTISELAKSSVAERSGIDNTPPKEAEERLKLLITYLLDPVREAWGAPIYVNSGYRCEALNKAVGGAKNSRHMLGEAADITAGSPEKNRRLFELIARMQREFKVSFDQLIDERNYSWIHVSYRNNNRNQILKL